MAQAFRLIALLAKVPDTGYHFEKPEARLASHSLISIWLVETFFFVSSPIDLAIEIASVNHKNHTIKAAGRSCLSISILMVGT